MGSITHKSFYTQDKNKERFGKREKGTFSRILLRQVLGHVLHRAEDLLLVPLDAGDLLSVPVRQGVAQSHLIKQNM